MFDVCIINFKIYFIKDVYLSSMFMTPTISHVGFETRYPISLIKNSPNWQISRQNFSTVHHNCYKNTTTIWAKQLQQYLPEHAQKQELYPTSHQYS